MSGIITEPLLKSQHLQGWEVDVMSSALLCVLQVLVCLAPHACLVFLILCNTHKVKNTFLHMDWVTVAQSVNHLAQSHAGEVR